MPLARSSPDGPNDARVFDFSALADLATARPRRWHQRCTTALSLDMSRPRREHA